jgi:hypothetical protein
MKRRLLPLLVVVAFGVLLAPAPQAHEVPADVRIQMFIKPDGQLLRVLVRVPMASINDIPWPQRQDGMLDFASPELGRTLAEAATQGLADQLLMYENGAELTAPRVAAAIVSLPSDLSFESFDAALAHITGPRLPDDTSLMSTQGLLDVAFEYQIQSAQSKFAIHPNFRQLGLSVLTVLRFLPPGGSERALALHDDPGIVHIDPSWLQAARLFVEQGFFHILDGIDHLLFLLCLVIPFRRFRALVPIVTAFTVAHSVTLIASAYDMAPSGLWFPPLVETLIALSIVYMALENIVASAGASAGAPASPDASAARVRRRWIVTFAFGLIHGFGFSFALREELQLAGAHVLTSLLAFNVGVELGQLLVLALVVPLLTLAFRFVVPERIGAIILSALVAHTGWEWMLERGTALRLYQFEWPAMDAAFFALMLRWAILIVALGGAAWLIFGVALKRRRIGPGEIQN